MLPSFRKKREFNALLFAELLFVGIAIRQPWFPHGANIALTSAGERDVHFHAVGRPSVILTGDIDVSVRGVLGMFAAVGCHAGTSDGYPLCAVVRRGAARRGGTGLLTASVTFLPFRRS
jgi:ribose/xylose/arabinose/galactoside ABC-type transport system permease subunit